MCEHIEDEKKDEEKDENDFEQEEDIQGEIEELRVECKALRKILTDAGYSPDELLR
jgi:hypothetical protein